MTDEHYAAVTGLIRKAMDEAVDNLRESLRYQAAIDATKRTCGKCGLACGGDDVDPCLGLLPGVRFACCGHGEQGQGYIQFINGKLIRFDVTEDS